MLLPHCWKGEWEWYASFVTVGPYQSRDQVIRALKAMDIRHERVLNQGHPLATLATYKTSLTRPNTLRLEYFAAFRIFRTQIWVLSMRLS